MIMLEMGDEETKKLFRQARRWLIEDGKWVMLTYESVFCLDRHAATFNVNLCNELYYVCLFLSLMVGKRLISYLEVSEVVDTHFYPYHRMLPID